MVRNRDLLTIQNSYQVISSINKLNKRLTAKSIATFDFSMLCTKLSHDKLHYVLSETTDFVFKGGIRDYVTAYNSGAFWHDSFFQLGSKIFRPIIGIPTGLDPAQFFTNLSLFFYVSEWLKSIKNTNYGVATKLGNIFRFIYDLIAINDGKEFENHCNEIYPPGLTLKKGNT